VIESNNKIENPVLRPSVLSYTWVRVL